MNLDDGAHGRSGMGTVGQPSRGPESTEVVVTPQLERAAQELGTHTAASLDRTDRTMIGTVDQERTRSTIAAPSRSGRPRSTTMRSTARNVAAFSAL